MCPTVEGDPHPNYDNQGESDAENNVRPSPEWNTNVIDSTSLKGITEDEKEKLLESVGYLFGICMDRVDGPIRSSHPVARNKSRKPQCVREINNVIVDVITTRNEFETNYVHQGWSLAAASTILPWTSSRIARQNQPNQAGVWVTKRTIVRRLVFRLFLEELVPELRFKSDIEAALEEATTYEKFQAVYRALHTWGDVLPLEFEAGLALSITDTETNVAQVPNLGTFDGAGELVVSNAARIAKQGGDMTGDSWSSLWCLAATAPPLQWSMVRIVSVVPTTDLLEDSLKERLLELYDKRLSNFPLFTARPTEYCKMSDDYENASKTISSIIIRARGCIDSIMFNYLDGTKSNRHGNRREVEDEYKFSLRTGEYISEMIIWSDGVWIYGIQFITSVGRVSVHYGGCSGTPTVARSRSGVLVGLRSKAYHHNSLKEFFPRELEGIWRHDLLKIVPKEGDVFSGYFGGAQGAPFNDRTLVRNWNFRQISRVDVGCSSVIDSIQFRYVHDEGGRSIESQTSCHGGAGGAKRGFVLEPGERIVTISGKHNNGVITQLCFATNLGRTSDIFCGGEGNDFSASAPLDSDGKRMCLHYICGKSDVHLNGIVFVWTPVH